MDKHLQVVPPVDAGGIQTHVDVPAACRAEMEAVGLSRVQAAREMGVSQGTLSRWLRGSYPGDVSGVEAKVLRWLETRAEAARRGLGGAGLDRHAQTGASEEVFAALAYAQAAGDVVLAHGPSGRGKTWSARRYCSERAGASYLAVTGATVTLAGLLNRLADAVGAGGRHGSALEAETVIVSRLRDRNALLVVDEAHHLRAALVDELRCIRDLAGCGLALVGDDSIRMTLARCPQVTGRIGMRVDLRTVAEADVVDVAAAVLGRQPGGPERKPLLAAARGPGGLHALRRLLGRGWMIARAEGRERIGAEDIVAAAEDGS